MNKHENENIALLGGKKDYTYLVCVSNQWSFYVLDWKTGILVTVVPY